MDERSCEKVPELVEKDGIVINYGRPVE